MLRFSLAGVQLKFSALKSSSKRGGLTERNNNELTGLSLLR
jgi:hypothetical protein